MSESPILVWFRNDLRLSDNPAFAAAASTGGPVIPVFFLDPDAAGGWARGGASRWWLHHSLESLDGRLREKDLRLVLRRGPAAEAVLGLATELGAQAVYWNRRYEPWAIDQDREIKSALKERDIACESFNGALLYEPWTISTKAGDPYKVFTPFWRMCRQAYQPDEPLRAPGKVAPPASWPASDDLGNWDLLPSKPDWAGGLRDTWAPGEDRARDRLQRFLDGAVEDYKAERDRPDVDGTSRLSPHLHFGEISPRQIWHAVKSRDGGRGDAAREKFLSELGWREFSYHLLYHFPAIADAPLRENFGDFPWRDDGDALRAWQQGRTGIPIVDAGMRQLWHTGWMHNRVRMVVASFLTKNLLIPWQEGARWFWDTLVDADLANNSAGWQWVAGCGADAAPYFRIFNPVAQGQKFDPDGAYVRRWVPELADASSETIHETSTEDRDGGGEGPYPAAIVDLKASRQRALDAYDEIKSG